MARIRSYSHRRRSQEFYLIQACCLTRRESFTMALSGLSSPVQIFSSEENSTKRSSGCLDVKKWNFGMLRTAFIGSLLRIASTSISRRFFHFTLSRLDLNLVSKWKFRKIVAYCVQTESMYCSLALTIILFGWWRGLCSRCLAFEEQRDITLLRLSVLSAVFASCALASSNDLGKQQINFTSDVEIYQLFTGVAWAEWVTILNPHFLAA